MKKFPNSTSEDQQKTNSYGTNRQKNKKPNTRMYSRITQRTRQQKQNKTYEDKQNKTQTKRNSDQMDKQDSEKKRPEINLMAT